MMVCLPVIEKNNIRKSKVFEDYRNGKDKVIGYLVGQTMKEMKGKADPSMVKDIIYDLLNP